MDWSFITSYLLPPLSGGVIGYVTNALAIRMLFRPYKAVYLGSVRLPFTPGIIPKQRDRLAKSLGVMVGQELFEEEGIRSHLRGAEVQTALREGVSRLSEKIFGFSGPGSDAGDDVAGIPENRGFKKKDDEETEAFLRQGLPLVLNAFFRSPRFQKGLGDLIPLLESQVFSLKLSSFYLSPQKAARLAEFFSSAFSQAGRASGPEGRETFAAKLSEFLKNSGLRPRDLAGDDWFVLLKPLFDRLYPQAQALLFDWLASPAMKKDLESKALGVLDRAFKRLNPVQMALLRLGQYDARLRESMPATVSDALAALKDFLSGGDTKEALWETLRSRLAVLNGSPISELADAFRHGGGTEKLLGGLSERRLVFLKRLFRAYSRAVAGGSGENLSSFLEKNFGIKSSRLVRFLHLWALRFFAREGTAPAFLKFAEDFLRKVAEAQGAGFSAERPETGTEPRPWPSSDIQEKPSYLRSWGLSDEEKRRVDDYVSVGLTGFLLPLVPKLIREFNVQSLVEKRVSQLNTAELEKLVVGLVGREFTWINIIGGILGALIGLSQIVINLLT